MEIIFESDHFNIQDENSSVFGKGVVNWLKAKLFERGIKPSVEQKEWGWLLKLDQHHITIYIGISTEWKDLENLNDRMIAWRCFTGYKLNLTGKILNIFGKLEYESQLNKINWLLKEIISNEDGVKIINVNENIYGREIKFS